MRAAERDKPRRHGFDHSAYGADPAVGPWIYVGTSGEDGVDDKLAVNPSPYATPDMPGPPPFQNGITNLFAEDDDGNPGDGLRYRWTIHGVQIDCGGGLANVTDDTVITTLIGVPLPDSPKPGLDALVDGSGGFTWRLEPNGDLVFLSALGDIDGGGP